MSRNESEACCPHPRDVSDGCGCIKELNSRAPVTRPPAKSAVTEHRGGLHKRAEGFKPRKPECGVLILERTSRLILFPRFAGVLLPYRGEWRSEKP